MTDWVISWVSPAQTWSGFSYIQGLNHTVIALRTPSTGTIWYGSWSSWMRCCSRFQAQADVIRPLSTGRPSLVRSSNAGSRPAWYDACAARGPAWPGSA
jgi:hypothetical protein